MLMPTIMSMMATNMAYQSANIMFGANQAMTDLANNPTGDISTLASQDKALALQAASAQTNYLVAQAMQESAQALRKKNQEQRQRLMDNGALFV